MNLPNLPHKKKTKKELYGPGYDFFGRFATGMPNSSPSVGSVGAGTCAAPSSPSGPSGGTSAPTGAMGEDVHQLDTPIVDTTDKFSQSPDEDEEPTYLHEFSCAMLNLTPAVSAIVSYWIRKNIPRENLYINEESGHEDYEEADSLHTTIKYGIHSTDVNLLADLTEGYGPIVLKFGKVGKFDHPDYDVLIIEVESNVLRELNKTISENMDCTDTHPDYHPHITLGYVKKGTCDGLVGNDFFTMLSDEIDEILFASKSGEEYTIGIEI